MKLLKILPFLCLGSVYAQVPEAAQALFDRYQQAGDAQRGQALWQQQHNTAGKNRRCGSCHGDDLSQTGKHATTGKIIQPMALSVNPQRYQDPAKIEKWFKRNCQWTLGRECSPQEKADFLRYLIEK